MAQSFRQLIYNRYSDFAALASFTSEASLLSGNSQPVLYHPFWDFTQIGRQVRIYGRGVLSSSATPTYTFTVRMGSAAASLAGTVLGISPAITTASGITNQLFEFYLNVMLVTAGIGSGNATLTCEGMVSSPGGFASPFAYSLIPNQGALATWTATCDSSVDNFINVSVTSSASSASNTLTLKHLEVEALN